MNKAIVILLFVFEASLAATVFINPTDNFDSIVQANPAGTTFIVRTGTHRFASTTPKSHSIFIGETGALLTGARVLTSWTVSGSYWVATGQTQEGQVHGECDATLALRCDRPEDLFVNGVPFQHVASLSAVNNASKWYFDYATDSIYIMTNPAGKTIETSVSRVAFAAVFGGSVTNVTIRNLIIEKYAIPAQMGAVGDQFPAAGWTVEDCEIRWCHGTGLTLGANSISYHNNLHHNGQKGIGATGNNVVVEATEIAFNNWAGFDIGWEAGGSKFAVTDGLQCKNNWVHHNKGPGFWTDIDNIRCLYENNLVEDNGYNGIQHEISYSCIFRRNVVRRNGFEFDPWLWGSQILIQNSRNCEVLNNIVELLPAGGNAIGIIWQNRGTGAFGEWISIHNSIHHNHVIHKGIYGLSGLVQDVGTAVPFTPAGNNTFNFDNYHVPDVAEFFWQWNDTERTFTQFRSYGKELNGTIDTNINYQDGNPSVSITQLRTSASCTQPRLTIQATASDDFGINRVEFRVNSVTVCVDFRSPYECVWNGTVPATLSINAVAFDIARHSATSATISYVFQ